MWALRARPKSPSSLPTHFLHGSMVIGHEPPERWHTLTKSYHHDHLTIQILWFCFRKVTNRELQKNNMLLVDIHSFLSISLATPRLTLSRYCEDSLINFLLITTFINCRPEGYWENCNIVGSLNLAACLAGTEPGNFRFLRDALTH